MEKSKVKMILSIGNIIGFLATIIVNALANLLPLNNKTTGELSDQYPNLFVPAGLTFSIWGVIYLLLGIFSIYQVIYIFKENKGSSSFIDKIGGLFILASAANVGWIFAWHYEMVAISLIIMIILLGSLLAIYLRLGIGRASVSKKERYLVHLPFSVYLGWITIATIANVTSLLVDIRWIRFGLTEEFWTILVILIGIAIAMIMLFNRKDLYYSIVIEWALLGILIKRLSVDPELILSVIITVIFGMVIIAVGIIIQSIRKKTY